MDDLLSVKIVEHFQNLGEVVDHNLPFLLGELQLLVDVLHEGEDVAVGTELQHDADIVLTAQVGVHTDHPWVRQLPQNCNLHQCFVHLLQLLEFGQLQRFQSEAFLGLDLRHVENLAI